MNPPRYRHLIWDWNGTLLDDVEYCVGVMNVILRRRGLPELDRQRYHAVFGAKSRVGPDLRKVGANREIDKRA